MTGEYYRLFYDTLLWQVGSSVLSAMTAADRFSVWVMQGWLFLDKEFWGEEQAEALLTSVPQGKMLALDLDSTDREQFTRTRYCRLFHYP